MNRTKIEYLDYTWNPMHGCTAVSDGCLNCWAERQARRLAGMGMKGYSPAFPFMPTFHPERLDEPMNVKESCRIGVAFMGDLFLLSFDEIQRVYETMETCPQHTFLILTKRAKRMALFYDKYGIRPQDHIWLGVTVEAADYAGRIRALLKIPARVRFVSCEPLLGRMDLKEYLGKDKINWVIVGGETGSGPRPMNKGWARDIRNQCRAAGIAFFMKQMDGKRPIPKDLMIRQYPEPQPVHIHVNAIDAQSFAKVMRNNPKSVVDSFRH